MCNSKWIRIEMEIILKCQNLSLTFDKMVPFFHCPDQFLSRFDPEENCSININRIKLVFIGIYD